MCNVYIIGEVRYILHNNQCFVWNQYFFFFLSTTAVISTLLRFWGLNKFHISVAETCRWIFNKAAF